MRTWSVFGGRFLGVEFRIHMAFLLVLVFVVKNYFSSGDPGDISRGLALTALVLLAVFLHEVGHVFASLRLGRRVRGTILFPIGGVALADANQDNGALLSSDLRIAAVGPIVNLFLAGVSGLVFLGFYPPASLLSRPWISTAALGKS